MRRFLMMGLIAVAGCGDSGVQPGGNDLSAGPDLAMAGGGNDLANQGDDAAAGADLLPGPDLKMVNLGKKLTDGNLSILTVTSDGWVVVIDDATLDVSVINTAGGGAPTKLCSNGDPSAVVSSGKVVFAWHDLDGNSNGALTVWSAASGAKEVSALAGLYVAAASSDGTLIAYGDNVTGMNGDFADLTIDKVDHTAPKVVAKQVSLLAANCSPVLEFAGSRLIASHCPTGQGAGGGGGNGGGSSSGGQPNASDGGAADLGKITDSGVVVDAAPPVMDLANPAQPDGGMAGDSLTVTSYDATGAGIDLITHGNDVFAVNRAGTFVVVVDSNSVGTIVAPNSPKAIVSGLKDIQSAQFTVDGSALLYSTNGGAILRVATGAGSTPVSLQSKNLTDFLALSPDGKWMLYFNMSDMTGLVDVFLASATQAGAATTLVKGPTGATGGIFGDSFTDDSLRAIFYPDVDMNQNGTATWILAAGGKPQSLAPASAYTFAAGGSKVAYSANAVVDAKSARADILVGDLAGGNGTLVATQADINFNVTKDRKTVVYSFHGAAPLAGIYAAPIP